MNDLVAPAFASAGIPVTEEPQGLSRSDGKRPDGLTTIPWQAGGALTWDVTVVCPLAESYVQMTQLYQNYMVSHTENGGHLEKWPPF